MVLLAPLVGLYSPAPVARRSYCMNIQRATYAPSGLSAGPRASSPRGARRRAASAALRLPRPPAATSPFGLVVGWCCPTVRVREQPDTTEKPVQPQPNKPYR
jgi:hypothetical protein